MPPDNPVVIPNGVDIEFPRDGPNSGVIARISTTTFRLNAIGTYSVYFQVSVTQSAQLVVTRNGVELPYTVVGRATGTSQIIGLCLVNATAATDTISIRNPVVNVFPNEPLTITPAAGGNAPVSAHLVIIRLR